jgi:hypothetical protein
MLKVYIHTVLPMPWRFYVMRAKRKLGQQLGGLVLGSSMFFAPCHGSADTGEKRSKNSFHASMQKHQNFIYTSFCRCHGVLRDA